ncbi:MAG: PilZ domain-containing protein [Deltaproteobacteria bacterium]|nr:PilZ domain-containing protein [Deltaproteobacteria bacterium]
MSRRNDTRERRRHKRFSVQEGTLAVFGGRPGTVGPVIDISMGGLAFHYTGTGELPKEPSKLDILLSDRISHLYALPCETVYDFETGRATSFPSVVERRRGVKFGKLTPNQKSQLEDFIEDCAQDEA